MALFPDTLSTNTSNTAICINSCGYRIERKEYNNKYEEFKHERMVNCVNCEIPLLANPTWTRGPTNWRNRRNKWKQLDFTDYYVSSHAMIYYKNSIYLMFGETGKVDASDSRFPTNDIYIYNILDDEEEELVLQTKPKARRNVFAHGYKNFDVVFGGDDCDSVFTNDTFFLDLDKRYWCDIGKHSIVKPPERRYQADCIHGD